MNSRSAQGFRIRLRCGGYYRGFMSVPARRVGRSVLVDSDRNASKWHLHHGIVVVGKNSIN